MEVQTAQTGHFYGWDGLCWESLTFYSFSLQRSILKSGCLLVKGVFATFIAVNDLNAFSITATEMKTYKTYKTGTGNIAIVC